MLKSHQDIKLIDKLNRPLRDLRISVIDQCNFRCSYCMPKNIFGDDYAFLPKEQLLSFDEIERIATIFSTLGVEKIRLTGGEPLLRKDLHKLVERLHQIKGIKDVALTTNGVLLPKYATLLKEAGLDRVNVSLDAMDDDLFGNINGRNVKVHAVLKGIEAAQKAGLYVKVNMVVKKNLNDHQILPMATYFKEKDVNLRFIEYMDVGNSNGWDLTDVVTKKDIVDIISKELPVEPLDANYYGEVASRYRYVGTTTEFGIISSVSDSFCSSCTRIRLSADGKLYTCLFADSGFDLKTLMRKEQTSDQDIEQALKNIWKNREDRYSDLRMEMTKKGKKRSSKIEMSYIGG